ncbi:hypothetical protein AAMO2058_000514600 [Amorphochlora amoebiformis]
MGNSPYNINGLKENTVCKLQQSFNVKLSKEGGLDDCNVNIKGPTDASLEVVKSDLTMSGEKKSIDFSYKPEIAGKHTVTLDFTSTTDISKNIQVDKLVTVFTSQNSMDNHLKEIRRKKAEAKRLEEQEKKRVEAFKASGGIFSLKNDLNSVGELKEGTNIQVSKVLSAADGLVSVVINEQRYKVKMSDLTPDLEANQQILDKLKTLPSFPEIESRRQVKPWTNSLPISAVLKGAATLNDVYTLKQLMARGVDPNVEFTKTFKETPLSLVAKCGPAKKPEDWKTEAGVSRNWNYEGKFATYRQARESCSVASAIVLLLAGAKITDKVMEAVNKESFFAKGIKRTRMLRVFDVFNKGMGFKIDWTEAFKALDDLEAEWPPKSCILSESKGKTAEANSKPEKEVMGTTTVATPASPAESTKIEFSDFPVEESRRPKDEYPADVDTKSLLKGACYMKDVYMLKKLLKEGADPNTKFRFGKTPLSVVAAGSPAKDPKKWKTEFGISSNWSHEEFSTYRQSREADSVACAILLLQAGAKITEKVESEVKKPSFFAKTTPRTRMLRVLDAFKKKIKIDWTNAFNYLNDLNAPWPPLEGKLQSSKKKANETNMKVLMESIASKFFCPTKQQLEQLWDYYDSDNNGQLDAKECTLLLKDIQKTREAKLQEAMNKENNPMALALHKRMQEYMNKSSEKIEKKEYVQEKLKQLDVNKDGKVEKDEFLANANEILFKEDSSEEEKDAMVQDLLGGIVTGLSGTIAKREQDGCNQM